MSACKRVLLAACIVVATLVVSRRASAQEYLVGASAALGSGIQGGGGATHGGFALARTRLRLGIDLRVDEWPKDVIAGAIVAEIQPRAAVGVDLRYGRLFGKRFFGSVGGIAYIAPATLLGPSAALEYRIPLGSSMAIAVGPEANFFVLGNDLPDGTVIWQVLLNAGAHFDL